MLQVLRDSIQVDKTKYTRMAKVVKGVSEETKTGVLRLKDMAKKGVVLIPVVNVNDCVTQSKFDNVSGRRLWRCGQGLIFAVARIPESTLFINGSQQNTFVPGEAQHFDRM